LWAVRKTRLNGNTRRQQTAAKLPDPIGQQAKFPQERIAHGA
jgi:hypothetical protein